MTEEALQSELVKLKWRYDTEQFAGDLCWIVNKDGALVNLRYNKGQQTIRAAIEKQRLEGKPVRIALLKARQFGGSTEFEAELFKESMLRPYRSSMIIAHDLDSARHLREMSARFYDNYPLSKPPMKKETDKWWKFKHKVAGKYAESHLRVDTAEELSTGHSLTLHNLHLSEIQNWRNATVLVKGLFPTVPNSADTMIFMEGTGSGVGDYWYDFCQMAQDPLSGWEFVFVPWFDIEDYRLPFTSEGARGDFEGSLDGDEQLLLRQGVALEALYWRRVAIKDTYKGDIDAFHQQYPATPDEAFLTSGRPVFNPLKVKQGLARSKKPLRTVNLVQKEGEVLLVDDDRGYWEIYEERHSGVQNLYCLGADVAEGIQVVPELGNRGGDFSVAKILRRDTRTFVAKLRERIDPDVFADELHKAGLYWRCGILVESNPGGSGNVVIRNLKDIANINLLKRQELGKLADVVKEEYGWKTLKDTKRILIDELTEHIREEDFTDHSKNFWYECSTYARDEKGRTNAQSRKYDDEVMAEAIAFQADKMMPMLFRPEVVVEEGFIHPGLDVPANWKKRSGNSSREEILERNYAEF